MTTNGGLNVPVFLFFLISSKAHMAKKKLRQQIMNGKKCWLSCTNFWINRFEWYGPCIFNENVKNNFFWSNVFKAYAIFCSKNKQNSASQLSSIPKMWRSETRWSTVCGSLAMSPIVLLIFLKMVESLVTLKTVTLAM